MKFLGLLSMFAFLALVHGGNVNILDKDEEHSTQSIVQNICWHTKGKSKQISNPSTVAKIAEHLKSLPEDDKLVACKRIYLESVEELASVISLSNDNVCSDEKISAIQNFHRNYILKGEHNRRKAPKILATFFYHYVDSISQVCAKETAKFLESLNKSAEVDTTEIDNALSEVTGVTGAPSSSRLQYQDIYLIWSMVDMLPFRNHEKIKEYLFDGKKRVVMGARNLEGFTKMRHFCTTKARPLYSKSLLSTIKLIDMGYYPVDSTVLDQLNNNKNARRFYELTKICETLSPVRLVEYPVDGESDIVFLKREEVEKLDAEEEQTESEVGGEACSECSMDISNELPSVSASDAIPVGNRVKNNIQKRKGVAFFLLKMFIQTAKNNIGANLKKLFGGEAQHHIESADVDQLHVYEVSEENDTGLTRARRGLCEFFGGLLGVLLAVLFMIYQVIVGVAFFPLWLMGGLISLFID